MVFYNVVAVLILGAAGIQSQTVGVLLWPAVLLHVVTTVWCVVNLRSGTQEAGWPSAPQPHSSGSVPVTG